MPLENLFQCSATLIEKKKKKVLMVKSNFICLNDVHIAFCHASGPH